MPEVVNAEPEEITACFFCLSGFLCCKLESRFDGRRPVPVSSILAPMTV